jgi:hypothetical protein
VEGGLGGDAGVPRVGKGGLTTDLITHSWPTRMQGREPVVSVNEHRGLDCSAQAAL